ncbi:MAG TPA: hypothetical protein VMD09_07485 [Solirubrobacteraceae bacterium]|nr:hypothetical protein [Solirubrobacteraceae bacterium]
MPIRLRNRTLRCVATLAVAGLGLAACGGGSNDQATTLLHQTFTGNHRINSGIVGLSLAVTPSGSSALKGPISLSLGGPFQSLGSGKLPQSDFTLTLGTSGGNVSVGILSTGSQGYVSFEGQSYQLPPATFQRLESSFAQLGSSPGSKSGSGVLARLGIQPQHWLVNPQVVGNEALDGTNTTHIRAGINVPALLQDLNTFLSRASSVGASTAKLPTQISPATRSQIASEIHNPSIDVWTGTGDKTLRRLDLSLKLDTTGETSALLGPSAALRLTMEYANLNQAQSITAPKTVLPYSQFQDKLKVLLADLQSGLTSGGTGTGATGTSGTGTTGSGGAASSTYQRYAQCIQAAGSDIANMQKCAPLLNGG